MTDPAASEPGAPARPRPPALPHLPGVRFRAYRDVDDLRRLVELFNRCLAADGIDIVHDFEGMVDVYLKSERMDAARDVLLVETDAVLVGFSRIRSFRQVDGDHVFQSLGHVDPAWRRRGMGTALLRHHEAQRRRMAGQLTGAGHRWLETFCYDTEHGARALLTAHGYAPVPEQEVLALTRPTLDDLPDAPLPQPLQLRHGDPGRRRAAWDLLQSASAEDPNFAPGSEDDFRVWAEQAIWDDSLWRLAYNGDELVGMVLSYIVPEENAAHDRRRGYTEYVNVAKGWRRRGVARALLVEGMKALRDKGMTEASLDVLVHNQDGARRVYEALGYRSVRSSMVYRKPVYARSGTSPGTGGPSGS